MRPMEKTCGRHIILAIAFLLLAWCPSAFALNPALDVNQDRQRGLRARELVDKEVGEGVQHHRADAQVLAQLHDLVGAFDA